MQLVALSVQACAISAAAAAPSNDVDKHAWLFDSNSHLDAGAPCARQCTREVYPKQEDFEACYACGLEQPFKQADLGSIEIVFTINYTRDSLLLGGVQSTLSTTCVSLLEEEGIKVCLGTYVLSASMPSFTSCYTCTYTAFTVLIQYSMSLVIFLTRSVS